MPIAAGTVTATCPSLWWLFENIANTFLPTNQVGSPCESFSHVSGRARQIRRTRSTWSSSLRVLAFIEMFSLRFGARGGKEFDFCGVRGKPRQPIELQTNLAQKPG